MADIYRYEYQDPIDSNVVWRWDFRGSDSTYGTSVVVEALSADCIVRRDTKFGWEYDADTYVLGIHKPIRADIKFKYDRLPTGLQSALCDTRSEPFVNIADTGLSFQTVEHGAVIKVYVSDDGGSTFRIVWAGTQDLDSVVQPELKTFMMPVKFVDLFQVSMKLLDWGAWKNAMWNAWGGGGFTDERRAVIDWVWKGTDWHYVVHVTSADVGQAGNTWMMASIQQVQTQLTASVSAIASVIAREDWDSVPSITSIASSCYKQTYDSTPTAGTALSSSSVFMPVFVMDDNNPVNWNMNFCFTDELSESHASPWDWWVDIAKQSYRQHGIRYYDGTNPTGSAFSYAPLGTLLNEFDTNLPVPITTQAKDAKIKLFDRRLRISKASTEFGIDDDYTSAQAKASASRNDSTSTLPVIHSTSPVATQYQMVRGGSGMGGQAYKHQLAKRAEMTDPDDVLDEGRCDWSTKMRILGLYYFENPSSGGNAFQREQYIRCHSWVSLLNDGETATPPASSPVTMPTTNHAIGGYGIAIATQQQEGWLQLLATKVLDTFSDTHSATATVELDWNVLKTSWSGDDIFMAFYSNTCNVELDFSQYVTGHTVYDGAPTTWYVTKCEFNIETGKVALELWGKP